MTDVALIIKDIVDGISNRVYYTYSVDPAPLFTTHFYTCDTKWMRKGDVVTNNAGGYHTVSQLFPDAEFILTVAGQPPLTQDAPDNYYEIRTPYFITGTKLATNREWTIATADITQKTPIIWLLETIREKVFGRGSAFEREMEIRMFFLDETNPGEFYTEDHRREVVTPMYKLAQEFIRVIQANPNFKQIDEYNLKTFSRFGVENDQGVFKNVLDANLSGVELTMVLTKYKENCNPYCITP